MLLLLIFEYLMFSSERLMETTTAHENSVGTYLFGLLRVKHKSFLGENPCFSVTWFLSKYFEL